MEYLKNPLTESELKDVLQKLGKKAGEMVRTKEAVWKELGVDLADNTASLKAILENPVLLERPIVVRGDKAVIGRPPENVLGLL